ENAPNREEESVNIAAQGTSGIHRGFAARYPGPSKKSPPPGVPARMVADLAERHELVSDLFAVPQTAEAMQKYRLSDEQVASFHERGYVAGVRVLCESQVDRLCEELHELTDPALPGNGLFYEYNSNESVDRSKVLFHALGAWRITPGFHDILWNPAFTVPA